MTTTAANSYQCVLCKYNRPNIIEAFRQRPAIHCPKCNDWTEHRQVFDGSRRR